MMKDICLSFMIDIHKSRIKRHCVPTERPKFALYILTHIWFLRNPLKLLLYIFLTFRKNVMCVAKSRHKKRSEGTQCLF